MKSFLFLFISFFTSGIIAQDTTLVCFQEDLDIHALDALNTKSVEFSPAYYGGGLVFVVARERNNLLDRRTGLAYFDLMYSELAPDGSPVRPVNFSPNIRTKYHEGPTAFSKAQDEIFFSRSSNTTGIDAVNKKPKVQSKIFHGRKGADDWENITELPFTSDEYSTVHPALSADGRWLVFSSNMPGGLGGMDLYVVERKGNDWMIPVNLGPAINSKGNDVFPFWHESGYLFFSSDGRKGHGGLDLYVTAWVEPNFKGLQHLLFPFNSTRDDLGFIVSPDGRSGYFASDRKPTRGKDDLYRWSSPVSIFCSPSLYRPVLIEREILVTDLYGEAVPSAYAWIIPMGDEGPSRHSDQIITRLEADPDQTGSFYLRWGMTDTLSTMSADGVSGMNGRLKIEVDKNASYAVVIQHNAYQPFVQVFTGEMIPSYIRLTKKPEATLRCYNQLFTVFGGDKEISLEGASIHISSACLKAPLTIMTNVLGNVVSCLPADCAVNVEITHEGFAPHVFTYAPSEEGEHWLVTLKSSAGLTSPPAPIASGTLIVLDHIYYDFNKSAIRTGDAGELHALADILNKYPDLTIELNSHTDTRGSDEYNMELSARRSEASKKYLVLLGVDPSRIVTKAAGESQPRNHCTDGVPCSEDEHQYNRRTEVTIINPAQGMQIRYKSE